MSEQNHFEKLEKKLDSHFKQLHYLLSFLILLYATINAYDIFSENKQMRLNREFNERQQELDREQRERLFQQREAFENEKMEAREKALQMMQQKSNER